MDILVLLGRFGCARQKLGRRHNHERVNATNRTLAQIQTVLLLLLVAPLANTVQAEHVVAVLQQTEFQTLLENILGTNLTNPLPLRNSMGDIM